MTGAGTGPRARGLAELLRSAEFARAYTLTVFAVMLGAYLIEHLTSYATLAAAVVGLVVIGVAVLVARREEISFLRLMPTTLLLFLVWALISVAWSTQPDESFWRWTATAGIAVLAITIGHVRDTIQTISALGDVARVALWLSLALEIVSGILIDTPLRFIGIQGNLASWGPVQGIFGTRNALGIVAVLALVTFVVEYRTRSVQPFVGISSIVLAVALALLSASPTVFVLVAAVGLATGALALVRSVSPARRGPVQAAIAGVVVIGGVVVWAQRDAIIRTLGAADDLRMRTTLWQMMEYYVRQRPVQGWGWFGAWDRDEYPFGTINLILSERHATALNAYVDVLLQLGWAGVLLFCAFGGLALVRSWLDASQRRSIVYAWTPLILVALGVASLFESYTLSGFGWLLLVVAAVRAGQSRSWRERLDAIAQRPRGGDGSLG